MTVTSLRYKTIDECLGPSAQRYFGSGYRRTVHDLNDIEAIHDRDGHGTIRARASIVFPSDWSVKGGHPTLRPHLTTIDAALLSVRLAEIHLLAAHRLDSAQRRACWLRKLVLRSGRSAQESLDDLEIRASHVVTTEQPSQRGASTFGCRIGTINTQCEIAHTPMSALAESTLGSIAGDILGDPAQRYYGDGYRRRSHEIRNVDVDVQNMDSRAEVRILTSLDNMAADEGLGGLFQPAVSVIDGIVVLAQLSQALLYELDGISRGRSNTLWMSQVVVESTAPHQSLAETFDARTSITRTRLIDLGGQAWRSSDWAAYFHGFHFRYTLAHALGTPGGQIGEAS